MYALSDTTESDSSSRFDSEIEPTEDVTGWDDEPSDSRFDLYLKNKKLDQKLIKLANDRISLANVFKKYEIEFRQQYSPSGWTHRTLCPFKDHNEKTPSFSYNPQEDRFYCFGCQRGGKIVQFISYMENLPVTQVAKDLVKSFLPEDELTSEVEGIDDQSSVLEVLMDYAKCVSEFTAIHGNDPKAIKYAETVTWPLDAYIRNHSPTGSIVLEQLSGRVEMLKEYLDSYGDEE